MESAVAIPWSAVPSRPWLQKARGRGTPQAIAQGKAEAHRIGVREGSRSRAAAQRFVWRSQPKLKDHLSYLRWQWVRAVALWRVVCARTLAMMFEKRNLRCKLCAQ
jgi:hypothetical protein